nr:MAG TPA: hypothetical protein [Caudoviricetes sp.]
MQSIENIMRRVAEFQEKFSPTSQSEIVQRLMNAGRTIIEDAYATKDTNNVRYNQHDAYGYAVYFDGKEIDGTRGYLGAEMSQRPVKLKGTLWYGRKAVDRFLDSFLAEEGNVVTLVAVNAMFYSEMQEKGVSPLRRSYRILSQTFNQLEELKAELEEKYNVTLITAQDNG